MLSSSIFYTQFYLFFYVLGRLDPNVWYFFHYPDFFNQLLHISLHILAIQQQFESLSYALTNDHFKRRIKCQNSLRLIRMGLAADLETAVLDASQ